MICAFGPCTCPVDGTDDYCGPSCRLGIGDAKEPCKCGHAECSASVGNAPLKPVSQTTIGRSPS